MAGLVPRIARCFVALAFVSFLTNVSGVCCAQNLVPRGVAPESVGELKAFLGTYCLDCHSGKDAEADYDLSTAGMDLDASISAGDSALWEHALRRFRSRQMPPADSDLPSEAERQSFLTRVENALDQFAASNPMPGRTDAVRRLNRTEYGNAVRDLLDIEVDVDELIPADQSGHGFDNVTVGEMPPVLLSRYVAAAEKISRLAVGRTAATATGLTLRLPADRTQESHVEGLPLGTRGGTVFDHQFPASGEYEIQIRLMRDRDEKIEGLAETHHVDVLIDRGLAHRFTVDPPPESKDWDPDYTMVDKHLVKRIPVAAGPHTIGVTFPAKSFSLSENRRKPFDVNFNRHRHPRKTPAIYEVSIVGPFTPVENPSFINSPSRRKLFGGILDDISREQLESEEFAAEQARAVLSRQLRLAFRRPVVEQDLVVPMQFFARVYPVAGFEAAIETAVTTVLINPHFLFRAERDNESESVSGVFQVSDLELASRLSFFLWSSIPDEELLELAHRGALGNDREIAKQVARMLESPKAESLVTNFAAQWLYLRNLQSFQPDKRNFPNFDDNLRHAMRGETERLFAQVLNEDQSILKLIRPEATFLNERLAKHYGVKGVVGSQFRPVGVSGAPRRGGILRHGSILSVTSYATRTSPTVRGNWILENILGTPAPPPPPNIPALQEKTASAVLTVRQRLALHRANPACASCHDLIDPIGFVLESYDAVGRWRHFDNELPIDSAGAMPDGTVIDSVGALEDMILNSPELFASTLAEKLLTFGLGRGVELTDGPAVRKIVRKAASEDFRLRSILTGVALSEPFRMKELASVEAEAE